MDSFEDVVEQGVDKVQYDLGRNLGRIFLNLVEILTENERLRRLENSLPSSLRDAHQEIKRLEKERDEAYAELETLRALIAGEAWAGVNASLATREKVMISKPKRKKRR